MRPGFAAVANEMRGAGAVRIKAQVNGPQDQAGSQSAAHLFDLFGRKVRDEVHRQHPPVVIMIEHLSGGHFHRSAQRRLGGDRLLLHVGDHLIVGHLGPRGERHVEVITEARLGQRQAVAVGDQPSRCRDLEVTRTIIRPGFPSGVDGLRHGRAGVGNELGDGCRRGSGELSQRGQGTGQTGRNRQNRMDARQEHGRVICRETRQRATGKFRPPRRPRSPRPGPAHSPVPWAPPTPRPACAGAG